MATVKTYTVSLSPANKTDNGFTCQLLDPRAVKHTVIASTLPDLDSKIRVLAAEYCAGLATSCTVYVRLRHADDRKPAGFDKWSKSIEFIEYQAA